MNIESYFKPLTHLARCELNEIKKSDALFILTYFTLFIPLAMLGLNCLKGRVKNQSPQSPKAESIAKPILNPSQSPKDAESIFQKGLKEADPYKSTKLIYEASGMGHKEANFQLGIHYLKGHGIEPNYDMARACFNEAVKNNIPDAYCQLGYMARNGLGCNKDMILAAEYYHLANTKEGAVNFDLVLKAMSIEEKSALGLKIKNGNSSIKDPKLAFEIIKECADLGHAPSLNYLANCYKSGIGVEKNEQEMLKCYTLSAEKGYAAAYINLGICQSNGEAGLVKDLVKAIDYFQNAADLGRVDAYYYMGTAYTILRQTQKARNCYENGASLNHSGCCYQLAELLRQDKDYDKSFELLKKASDAGNIDAHRAIGDFYFYGYASIANPNLAFKHYLIAAQHNLADAQFCVGLMYELGQGIPKDTVQALKYYDLAAAQGYTDAKKAAEGLRKQLAASNPV